MWNFLNSGGRGTFTRADRTRHGSVNLLLTYQTCSNSATHFWQSCSCELLPVNLALPEMWLDRLSGHSTPSVSPPPPHKRSYSPAPKRPSQLGPGVIARPGYGPRTSSLGLGSRPNNSTASLQSPHLPNGSSLRQQITLSDVVDPLRTLEGIVGKNLSPEDAGSSDADKESSLRKPEQLELDIDFNGLSLHDFANGPFEGNRERSHSFNSQTAEECE